MEFQWLEFKRANGLVRKSDQQLKVIPLIVVN